MEGKELRDESNLESSVSLINQVLKCFLFASIRGKTEHDICIAINKKLNISIDELEKCCRDLIEKKVLLRHTLTQLDYRQNSSNFVELSLNNTVITVSDGNITIKKTKYPKHKGKVKKKKPTFRHHYILRKEKPLHKIRLIDGRLWPDECHPPPLGVHAGGGGKRPHPILYGDASPLTRTEH